MAVFDTRLYGNGTIVYNGTVVFGGSSASQQASGEALFHTLAAVVNLTDPADSLRGIERGFFDIDLYWNGSVAYNGTVVLGGSNASSGQASGQAIFWGLAAIVLNAMLQPSFSGYLFSGDIFRGVVWPHRSSPVLCLIDAYVDARLIMKHYRSPSSDRGDRSTAKSTTVVLRLVIFVIGVLPQIIRIFSTKGIPVSQAIAAAFLVSTIISMVRTLHIEDADKDIADQVDGLKDVSETEDFFNRGMTQVVLCVVGLGPHLGLLFWAWRSVSLVTKISSTESVGLGIRWTSYVVDCVFSIYVLQHTAFFMLFYKASPLTRRTLVVVITSASSIFNLASNMIKPAYQRGGPVTMPLMIHAAACSYGLACLLHFVTEKLRRAVGGNAHSSRGSQTELPTSAVELDGRTSHGQATTRRIPPDEDLPPRYSETLTRSSPDSTPSTEHDRIDADPPPPYSQAAQASANETASGRSTTSQVQDTSRRGGSDGVAHDGATAVAGQASQQQSSSANDGFGFPWNILVYMIVWPLVVFALILSYAGIYDLFGSNADEETGQHSAPEQGEGGQQQTAQAREEGLLARTYSFISSLSQAAPYTGSFAGQVAWQSAVLVNKLVKRIVRYALIVVGRFWIAIFGLYKIVFDWVIKRVQPHLKDVLWIAFGILNLMTAALYYLLAFNGQTTMSPAWTNNFG